jgi:hypothetical protein
MTEEAPLEVVTPEVNDSLITPEVTAAALDFAAGKPEGFPEDFWDMEGNKPNVDRLFKEFQNRDKIAKDLRVKLSKGEFTGRAPDDINEYTFELDESIKDMVPQDDPLMAAARQAAKDAGLPKDAFSKFMSPILAKLAEFKSQAEAPPSEEEVAANRAAEIAKLGTNGERVVATIGTFIDTLKNGGTFTEEEAQAAKAMANSASAVRVLNKFRMMSGMGDQVPVGPTVDERASISEISQKMAAAMAAGNEAEYNKFSLMLAKLNK